MADMENGGITCPFCGNVCRGHVLDSRKTAYGKRRRRVCEFCHKRFTTVEFAIDRKSALYDFFMRNWRN